MSEILPNSLPRDRVAECHTRAAEDRVRAEGMDTMNGRLKFEESAASWDERAGLLARLDASFNKRERLDAEAARCRSASQAERLAGARVLSIWEGEGGAAGSPGRSDDNAGTAS